MMSMLLASPFDVALATFLYCLAGALVPVFNIEAYLFAVSVTRPGASTLAVLVAASLGQMAGKSLLYLAGTGLLRLPLRRSQDGVRAAAARLARAKGGASALMIVSAVTGVPPFYAVSVAAGGLRVPFAVFLVAGGCGALARFAAVLILGRLLTS